MKSSLFKNLRLQTYLQIVNAFIPLITTPYIARVLGASMIGIFSSSHAIASFFTLFAVLGTGNYGTRCISAEKDDEKRKNVFIEIYIMQLITCVIATISYLLYCILFADEKMIAYLQCITLFGCFIDISWFYFGIEDFKTTVTCNLLFRVVSVVMLLTLVKNSADLWLYTIIMLGSAFMSQMVLWLLLIKQGYLKHNRIKIENIKRHFMPNIRLFIPLLAMTICHSTDKAMLGTISTYDQAGYYSNIDRVINVPFSIFSGFGTVFLPRMTSVFLESERRAKEFFFVTLSGFIMLGVAISSGIIALADSFIPFFLGKGYESCIFLIKVFSPVIIIKCISNALRMHYLVPFKMEIIYIKATIIGAALNVVLNFMLIPQYGALGAVCATIASEIIILLIQVVFTFKGIELKSTFIDLFFYVVIGIITIFVLQMKNFGFNEVIVKIFFDALIGAIIYCVLTVLYWHLSHNEFYSMYIRPIFARVI